MALWGLKTELTLAFVIITQILSDSYVYLVFLLIYHNYKSNHPRSFPYFFTGIQSLLQFPSSSGSISMGKTQDRNP